MSIVNSTPESLSLEAYETLHSVVFPIMEDHQNDLLIDRDVITQNPGIPFLHWANNLSTHMTMLNPADKYPAHGVRVPYLFGTADRYHLLNEAVTMSHYFHKPTIAFKGMIHHFDGKKLKRLRDTQAAIDISHAYERRIKAEWCRR